MSDPPHQLDDDGTPLDPGVLLADRRRRTHDLPTDPTHDLPTDPTHDTDVDAAIRARRTRKDTR